jgi:hypothetical protein
LIPWGITMPLRTSLRGAVREILHPPLRMVSDPTKCDCSLVQLTQDPMPDASSRGLAKLRAHHRRYLEAEYPTAETEGWVERHRGSA